MFLDSSGGLGKPRHSCLSPKGFHRQRPHEPSFPAKPQKIPFEALADLAGMAGQQTRGQSAFIPPCRNEIERHTQRRRSDASGISQKGFTDGAKRDAVLESNRANDSGIFCGRIAVRTDLAVLIKISANSPLG